MTLTAIRSRWTAFSQTDAKVKVTRALRWTFYVAIFSYLVYRLAEIGWSDLWANRPTDALYFVLLPVLYALLPIAEGLIYGRIWGIRNRDVMMASVKKRALNTDVVSYSGEVQFYLWAKSRVARRPGEVLKSIKDNLIISSASSIVSAVLILAVFTATGQLDLFNLSKGLNVWHVAGIGVTLAAIGAVLLTFRRQVFYLSSRTLGAIMVVHVARFVVGWMLLILQWSVVVPDAPFKTWAILLTAIVLVDRIPLLPSKDLVFVGVGIELAAMLQVPAAAIAAMFLMRSAFDKSLNLGLFVLSSVWPSRRGLHPVPVHAENDQVSDGVEEPELSLAPAA